MSALSAASELSVIVTSPSKCIGVALAVLLMELTLAVVAPWLLLRLRTTPEQRKEVRALSASIASLRRASNQLNSPATFAEYSKVQRQLNAQLKRQAQLHADIASGVHLGPAAAPILAVQQFALSYGIKLLVYVGCFLWCWGSTLFVVPVSGWITPLYYTPIRFVLGEVGIIPFLAICSSVAAGIKAWL